MGVSPVAIQVELRIRVYLLDPIGGGPDVLGADVHDAEAADPHRQGLGPQAFAAAGAAGAGRHIALDLRAGVV